MDRKELVRDIKAASAEIADGAKYPDLMKAIDDLAQLPEPARDVVERLQREHLSVSVAPSFGADPDADVVIHGIDSFASALLLWAAELCRANQFNTTNSQEQSIDAGIELSAIALEKKAGELK